MCRESLYPFELGVFGHKAAEQEQSEQHRAIMQHVFAGDMAALEQTLTMHTYKLLEDLSKIKARHRDYFV